MSKKVVAIVVTYNRKELLLECLKAIYLQTYQISQLILVDNASTDGTKSALINNGYFEKESFQYISMPTNEGGAGGFFKGIDIAKNMDVDWLWIMDDDTIPDIDCLEKLVDAQRYVNKKISFLASTVRGVDNSPMNVPKLDERKGENGYSDAFKYLQYGIVKVCAATFVSILVNKDAVRYCGLPCKSYFLWGDDIEYTMRLVKYYGDAYLIGESCVCHKRKGGGALSIKSETDLCRINNYYYMYRNEMINHMLYEPWYICIKEIMYKVRDLVNCLGSSNAIRKIYIIMKGTVAAFTEYKKYKQFIQCQINYNE